MADNDTTAFLLSALEENWLHARLSEEKRANLSYIVIALTVVVQAVTTVVGFGPRTFSLVILLPLLGLYSFAVTMKLYERAQFHTRRARKLRSRLNELLPIAQVEQLQHMAEEEHRITYRTWMDIRLNALWLLLYAAIMLLGCIDIFLCLR